MVPHDFGDVYPVGARMFGGCAGSFKRLKKNKSEEHVPIGMVCDNLD